MRKLNLTDVFRFSRMVKTTKVDSVLSDILKDAAAAQEKAASSGNEQWLYNIGIDGVLRLMSCAAENGAEHAVLAFFAPVWGISEQEAGELPLENVISNVEQMFRENDLLGFYKRAHAATR